MKFLVTGGSSGIGLKVSELLIHSGEEVISLARGETNELKDPRFYQIECDLNSEKNIENALSTLLELGIREIDGIFLNAGNFCSSTLEEIDSDLFMKLFGVNFLGNLLVLKKFSPLMKNSKIKSVVINSSDQVKIGKKDSILYGASKAALSHLSKSLTADYSRYGLRVNSILAGGTDTRLYNEAQKHKTILDIQNSKNKYPIGRIASTEEIAELVVFLLSPRSSFIAGAEVSIDGGLSVI